MPLPANYVIGIDVQQRDFENFGQPSYLRGQFQPNGWWYYYAYALLVKAPLGTLGLILMAFGSQISRRALCAVTENSTLHAGKGARDASPTRVDRRDWLVLLAPAAIIFVVASSKTGFSHHSRYILPCIPFVFIAISGLATKIITCSSTFIAVSHRPKLIRFINRHRSVNCAVGIIALGLLTWTIISSLRIYPHSISYFNELAGGPINGPAHLIHSNIDWGQDLLFLENWICDQKIPATTPVYLAFDNLYSPFLLDIPSLRPWPFTRDELSSDIPVGFYAICINMLYESPRRVRGYESRYYIDQRPLAYLRSQPPLAKVGYSIRVYSTQQLRDAYATDRPSH